MTASARPALFLGPRRWRTVERRQNDLGPRSKSIGLSLLTPRPITMKVRIGAYLRASVFRLAMRFHTPLPPKLIARSMDQPAHSMLFMDEIIRNIMRHVHELPPNLQWNDLDCRDIHAAGLVCTAWTEASLAVEWRTTTFRAVLSLLQPSQEGQEDVSEETDCPTRSDILKLTWIILLLLGSTRRAQGMLCTAIHAESFCKS